ncbi:MAG: phosphotriesterase-related protein [Alphaproteobacteria bacterium HGW-Alphaproteobacteria-10]|nr:MAG: phosphotriesterase-related protein [Alphaproteobacteria bacterium HGW-Alphaproteobacteria-10]
MSLARCHVGSGMVETVLGPIPSADMGVTLPHEHILNDCRCWWSPPQEAERAHLATSPVHPSILSELRMDPFACLDNCALDDEPLAVAELSAFRHAGGATVVDPTCRGIGRNPAALARISRATGLNVVMGAGYYLESSHPPEVAAMSAGAIAEQIEAEAHDGLAIDGDARARIGLIGEIGVSGDFTPAEEKSLRGAARAQARTGLALMVHLPGWFRHGLRVLDVVGEEGGDPRRTILCHMNPSFDDPDYQIACAQRGAFIEYDMVGMDYYYADQGVQCPSDAQTAAAIAALVEAGVGDRILLSQDVFLKMMLTRHGGNGYAFVLRHYAPRLRRLGVPEASIRAMLIDNARAAFDATARRDFPETTP